VKKIQLFYCDTVFLSFKKNQPASLQGLSVALFKDRKQKEEKKKKSSKLRE